MKQLFMLFLVGALLSGCFWFDSGVQWSHPPYVVHWIDTYDNRTLAYDLGNGRSIGRIPAQVIGVGASAQYVVVKQRVNSDIIVWYYIEKAKDGPYGDLDKIDAAVRGPFSKASFDALTTKLGLPEITVEF